jgi:hypothetical protein
MKLWTRSNGRKIGTRQVSQLFDAHDRAKTRVFGESCSECRLLVRLTTKHQSVRKFLKSMEEVDPVCRPIKATFKMLLIYSHRKIGSHMPYKRLCTLMVLYCT